MLRLRFFEIVSKDHMKMTDEQQKSTTKGHFLYFRVQKRTFLLEGVLQLTCQEKEYGYDPCNFFNLREPLMQHGCGVPDRRRTR